MSLYVLFGGQPQSCVRVSTNWRPETKKVCLTSLKTPRKLCEKPSPCFVSSHADGVVEVLSLGCTKCKNWDQQADVCSLASTVVVKFSFRFRVVLLLAILCWTILAAFHVYFPFKMAASTVKMFSPRIVAHTGKKCTATAILLHGSGWSSTIVCVCVCVCARASSPSVIINQRSGIWPFVSYAVVHTGPFKRGLQDF